MYRNLFIFTFGVFATLNTEMGIIGILPSIAHVTGKSISATGYLIGVFAITVAFIGPFFTFFILRFMKPKPAFILGQSLMTLNNAIFIFFPYYPLLVLARIIGGLGHPLFFSLALSYISQTFPKEKRTLATSILLSGMNIAFVVGFSIISWLTTVFSYKVGMSFTLLTNLLAILSIALWIPASSLEVKKEESAPLSLDSFRDRGFFISIPVLSAGMFIMYSYFAPFLQNIWHFNPEVIPQTVLIFGFSGLVGNILFGFIPSSRIALGVSLVILLYITVYILLEITFGLPFLLIVVLWGFAQSGIIVLAQVWFTLNKRASPEAVSSLMVSSCNIGITVGSFLGGIVISWWGLTLLPYIGIMIFALALVTIMWDTRTHQLHKHTVNHSCPCKAYF